MSMNPKNYLTTGFIDWIADYRNAPGAGKYLKRKCRRMVRRAAKKLVLDG